MSEEGPEDGHTWRFRAASQGSYTVVGEEGHHDAVGYGPDWELHVRAFSLRAALFKAAGTPLNDWDMHPTQDPEVVESIVRDFLEMAIIQGGAKIVDEFDGHELRPGVILAQYMERLNK